MEKLLSPDTRAGKTQAGQAGNQGEESRNPHLLPAAPEREARFSLETKTRGPATETQASLAPGAPA